MTISSHPDLLDYFRSHCRCAGTDAAGGFAYDLDLTKPWLATAIHAGHRMRAELLPLRAISEKVQRSEEDAATDLMIQGCASTLWGHDSRAEYDLNRAREAAVPITPAMFWGIRVYATPPDDGMVQRSRAKYDGFYTFLGSLITVLLERHGACLVYDIHSYNIQRQRAKGHPAPPVFNLGTRLLNRSRWGAAIDGWLAALADINLPGHGVTVAENDVFGGAGELCRRLTQWDANILVLPTEIAKIYMDEAKGILHGTTIEALKQGLGQAVHDHGLAFQRNHCTPRMNSCHRNG